MKRKPETGEGRPERAPGGGRLPLLEARDIRFAYPGREILRGVSLVLQAGQIAAILGPNGSGKSTLLRILLGLLKPTAGSAELLGTPISQMSRKVIAASVAYIPQQTNSAFAYTAADMVLMATESQRPIFSAPGSRQHKSAREALARVGAIHLRDRIFSTLSGGERQLVIIARALAQETHALIMDEPATGLDYGNQIRILELVADLSRSLGKAILLTTHTPEHALFVADKTILLKNGQVGASGPGHETLQTETLAELYAISPRSLDEFTARTRIRGSTKNAR